MHTFALLTALLSVTGTLAAPLSIENNEKSSNWTAPRLAPRVGQLLDGDSFARRDEVAAKAKSAMEERKSALLPIEPTSTTTMIPIRARVPGTEPHKPHHSSSSIPVTPSSEPSTSGKVQPSSEPYKPEPSKEPVSKNGALRERAANTEPPHHHPHSSSTPASSPAQPSKSAQPEPSKSKQPEKSAEPSYSKAAGEMPAALRVRMAGTEPPHHHPHSTSSATPVQPSTEPSKSAQPEPSKSKQPENSAEPYISKAAAEMPAALRIRAAGTEPPHHHPHSTSSATPVQPSTEPSKSAQPEPSKSKQPEKSAEPYISKAAAEMPAALRVRAAATEPPHHHPHSTSSATPVSTPAQPSTEPSKSAEPEPSKSKMISKRAEPTPETVLVDDSQAQQQSSQDNQRERQWPRHHEPAVQAVGDLEDGSENSNWTQPILSPRANHYTPLVDEDEQR